MTTISINTNTSKPNKTSLAHKISFLSEAVNILFRTDPIDVVVVNNYTNYHSDLSESELTNQAMNLSISSFSEEWDKEDDDYWNNY